MGRLNPSHIKANSYKIDSDGTTKELKYQLPRQLMKCQANSSFKITVAGESKKYILEELDRIGVNKASMFGDADSIADYIMNNENF